MKLKELKKATGKLLFFDKKSLSSLERKKDNLDLNIKYWLKNGDIISLKNGVYLLRDKYEREPNKDLYLEYLANQLLKPSYLSLEYVLDKYQILSEPARVITSVSSKSNRFFSSEIGSWRYYRLPDSLFFAYKIKYFKNQAIAEASKAKALFDFLYLRFCRGPEPSEKSIEELRLNLECLEDEDWKELKIYFDRIQSNRFKKVFEFIKKYAN
jgi:predicted transcriptional regulator of viral defense system